MRTVVLLLATVAIGAVAAAAGQSVTTPAPGFPMDVSAFGPQPCATVPSGDTLNGSVGAGNCYTRATDTRPTAVQAQAVTTDATGAWSLTWARAFASPAPYINAQPINTGSAQPYICNVTSSTATTAAGKCWTTQTMTLPAVVTALLGLVLNPTGAAASIQVRVAARDTTQ